MPGNGVEDRIRNLYELNNLSQGQHLSQAVGGNWQVIDYNQLQGKSANDGAVPNFNSKNYSLEQLGSDKVHRNLISAQLNPYQAQLNPRTEYLRDIPINNSLNANDFSLQCPNFLSKQNQLGFFGQSNCFDQQFGSSKGLYITKTQQDNEYVDSPTLTTNSERSEITEASSDFSFFGGKQQLVSNQSLSSPNIHQMQQSGYNDMQLLQQHMIYKQVQELQRQQQLQQLGDTRQQNSFNQLAKQAPGSHISPFINGMPLHDASQMLRNRMQVGTPASTDNSLHKAMLSQEQSPTMRPMNMAPQLLDMSLYGTPVSEARGNMGQLPYFQGMSHDSVNLWTKAGGQAPKSMVLPSGFGNPYSGDQSVIPSGLGVPQEAFMAKQGFPVKDSQGQVHVQSLSGGIFSGNLREGNSPTANNASVAEFSGREEHSDWPAMQHTTKQVGLSQGLVPLDPLEEKILYNTDDNLWDAFGGRPGMIAVGFGCTLEHRDSSDAFPSLQSGSWSALMQSAVAEASSSDTGLQEEWSGLTFQNTEHSNDNQVSNIVDSEKQTTSWVGNNLQNGSYSSKSFPVITDTNSSFPGFQQLGNQSSFELRTDLRQDTSPGSIDNFNFQQKQSVEESQKVQMFLHSGNAWPGQMLDHSQSGAQHQSVAPCGITKANKGHENMGRSQYQMNDGPHAAHDSSEKANETYEKQQHYYQWDGSTIKGVSGHEQGHFEQFKFFGSNSSGVMDVGKGSVPDVQGDIRTSKVIHAGGDRQTNSSTYRGSVFTDDSHVNARTSEHMLELIHKVDQSRDANTRMHYGVSNTSSLPVVPGSDSCDTSIAQLYAQSAASQGFGLKLAPPSQALPLSNSSLTPQGLSIVNNSNSRQPNPEVAEKNQVWLTPPSSFHSLPHESSQGAHRENRSGIVGNQGVFSNWKGNPVATFMPYANPQNELQIHATANVPVPSQSVPLTSPGAAGRCQTLSRGSSQDTFPVLETLAVPQSSITSGVSHQGEISANLHNVWRNVPTHRQSYRTESFTPSPQVSSLAEPQNRNMISTSSAPLGSIVEHSVKDRGDSAELPVPNSHNYGYGGEHFGKGMPQKQMSKMLDVSQRDDVPRGQELDSGATSFTFHPVVSHPSQQDLDRLGQGLELNKDASLSVLEVQHATGSGGQQLHDNSSEFRNAIHSGSNSASQPNLFAGGDTKMLNFKEEVHGGLDVKASMQTSLQATTSQEMVMFGCSDLNTQPSGINSLSTRDHNPVNLQVAPSWFKQYRTLQNGQMVPMFDARLAKAAFLQFSLGKPPKFSHASLERLDAGRGGSVCPSPATTLGAGQHLSASVSPLEAINQVAIIKSKKRKSEISDPLPWHKEVTQDSKRIQNLSDAEHLWAKATNRLSEKVEDEVETIEEIQPMHQSKRRLVFTTQLMQLLFHPAPTSIFCVDSLASCDMATYFVSRLSLGDACSFSCCKENVLPGPTSGNITNSEEFTFFGRSSVQQLGESYPQSSLEVLGSRLKKLENDIQRLDKTTSLLDLRTELQDLERFAVINRFAKFHARAPSDTSGTSSTSGLPRSNLQRYVTAFPLPRNLPEGVQCLSL